MSQLVGQPGGTLQFVLIGVTMLLVLRVVLRKDWLAFPVWLILGAMNFNPGTGPMLLDLTTVLLLMVASLIVLIRFGLLALLVAQFVQITLQSVSITLDPAVWYAGGSLLSLAVVAALGEALVTVLHFNAEGVKVVQARGRVEASMLVRRVAGNIA